MSITKTYTEAGKALQQAVNDGSTGFVARVDVRPGQANTAAMLGECRRVLARLHSAGRAADYVRAAAKESDFELAQAAAERRAMLAELLVLDVLREARVPFNAQPLVAHAPAPGCDLTIGGQLFDVKAAGQMSREWSYQCAKGVWQDDRQINVTRTKHEGYCRTANFAGYVCVYFYMLDQVPVAADIYVIDRDGMGPVQAQRQGLIGAGDYSYYALKLPFPDARHSADFSARRAVPESTV